ncbi:hypothetical protein TSUD_194920 [Trifolium subterraneum]|nr:hypothetical protein TSUD_194920 [Trifolium subterraneum]
MKINYCYMYRTLEYQGCHQDKKSLLLEYWPYSIVHNPQASRLKVEDAPRSCQFYGTVHNHRTIKRLARPKDEVCFGKLRVPFLRHCKW